MARTIARHASRGPTLVGPHFRQFREEAFELPAQKFEVMYLSMLVS